MNRIIIKIKTTWYDFRRRCQRFKRGWAYGNVWDIDVWFMRTVKPMLVHLRDYGIGIPPEFYNEDGNRIYWENTLTEMISCLELMDEDAAREHLGISDSDWFFESYKKTNDFMKKIRIGFSSCSASISFIYGIEEVT